MTALSKIHEARLQRVQLQYWVLKVLYVLPSFMKIGIGELWIDLFLF